MIQHRHLENYQCFILLTKHLELWPTDLLQPWLCVLWPSLIIQYQAHNCSDHEEENLSSGDGSSSSNSLLGHKRFTCQGNSPCIRKYLQGSLNNKSTTERVPMLSCLCKYEEDLSTNGKVMANIKVFQWNTDLYQGHLKVEVTGAYIRGKMS